MKKILKNQRGETIVEVLVSFVLLLMFTAMFVVSLRYARAMSQKAETLRETAYQLCAGLYPIPKTQGEAQQQENGWQPVTGKENMTFPFKSGEAMVFSVSGIKLDGMKVEANITAAEGGGENTKTESYTFHRYSKGQSNTSGGQGTP